MRVFLSWRAATLAAAVLDGIAVAKRARAAAAASAEAAEAAELRTARTHAEQEEWRQRSLKMWAAETHLAQLRTALVLVRLATSRSRAAPCS